LVSDAGRFNREVTEVKIGKLDMVDMMQKSLILRVRLQRFEEAFFRMQLTIFILRIAALVSPVDLEVEMEEKESGF
jgi:hypothetical protein